MELVPQREILRIFFFLIVEALMAVLISYLRVRSFFILTFSIAHLSLYPPAINQQNLIFAHQPQLTTTSFRQRQNLMIIGLSC